MPNHIHMIIIIDSEAGDRGRSPLQTIIRNMKAYVSKQIGFSPWQKSFHDHIIRNEEDFNSIAEYIDNNPSNWADDCFYL
jgi:REP element-mobilizing transposase RayT